MSSANLFRMGGLAAILAGILRGVASFIPGAAGSLWLELLYFVIDIGILFGIFSLYGLKHEKIGLAGFFGFVLASIGIGSIIGPDAYVSGVSMYSAGTLVFVLGLNLLGAALWLSNELPRWIPVLWIFSTFAGFIGSFNKSFDWLFVVSGALFGIGFAGAGFHLWSRCGENKAEDYEF